MSRFLCIAALFMLAPNCAETDHEQYRYHHNCYCYKEPAPDALVATFHSNFEGIAERNCRLFAEMHREKYGVELICTTQRH